MVENYQSKQLRYSTLSMQFKNNVPINIDSEIFDIKENVSSISTNVHTSSKAYTFYNESLDQANPNIFFILETPHHAAFCHWVFESAIFLPYVKQFKNAKLLLNRNPFRKYKKLFLTAFNLNDSDIVFLDNIYQENTEYTNIPPNNICIIPNHLTHCDRSPNSVNKDNLDRYTGLLLNFRDILINDSFTYEKTIDHLFLPRNTVENYTNQCINYSKIHELLKDIKYTEYDTMNTEDIKEQFLLISHAENIYLDFGSALFVNIFFSKQSNVYVVNKKINQYRNYAFPTCIIDIIERENNVVYL